MKHTAAGTPGNGLTVFRNRNFTLFFTGSLVANAGHWMQMVAQGWLVYQLSGSPLLLGVIGASRGIPMILLAPFGGVVADRVMRVKLLKTTQTVSMALALLQAVLVSLGAIEIWHLAALSVIGACVNAFDQPTRQALLPDLVRRDDLSKAIALNSSAWQGAGMFGPALAGITIATIGVEGAFFANAVSYVSVLGALFLLRDVPERSGAPSKKSVAGDFLAGISYVRSTPFILMLLGLATVTSIFGRSYQHLLPVFAEDVLSHGSAGLGFMMSAPGAGTLVGAAAIAGLRDIRRKGVALTLAMLLFSATVVVFSLNRSFVLAVGLLFVCGLAQLTFSTMLSTMLQLEVPGAMRGRVVALQTVTFQGFHPIGGLITGSVATVAGTPEACGASAVVVAVAAVLTLALAPTIRNYTTETALDAAEGRAVAAQAGGAGQLARAGAAASVQAADSSAGS